MKNSKIHSGLENSNLRDFLSLSLVKNYEYGFENKKQTTPCNTKTQNFNEWAIKDCENEITFNLRRLELLNENGQLLL